MITTYGYIGYREKYYDLSNNLTSAKISASRRGIKKVYKRTGYNTRLVSVKTSLGWIDEGSKRHKEWLESNNA